MSQGQESTGRKGNDRRGIPLRRLLTQAEQRMARANYGTAATKIDEHVEAARLALRAGHPRRAVAEFDRCVGMLAGDRVFMARRGYAQERLSRARRRPPPANSPPLTSESLQAVLRWLLREEIAAGERAISEGRPATAVRSLEDAERVDNRCSLVAFLHAKAILIGVQRAFEHGGKPDLERAAAYLEQAADLSRRAADDPPLRERSLALAAAIHQWLTPLSEQRDQAARFSALNDCVEAWQDLIDYYRDHPMRGPLDFINYRDRLAHVTGMIARARRDHRPDSAEGVLLADLARRVAEKQKNLPW
jgi:hypothetical protein